MRDTLNQYINNQNHSLYERLKRPDVLTCSKFKPKPICLSLRKMFTSARTEWFENRSDLY